MGSTKYPLVPPPGGGTPHLPGQGQPGPLKPGEYGPTAVPNIVSFNFDKVGPPSPLYIQRDDVIVLHAQSQFPAGTPDVVRFAYRLLLPSGPKGGQPDSPPPPGPLTGPGLIVSGFKDVISDTGGAQTATKYLRLELGEGYLLNLSAASENGAGEPGQTFAQAWLVRNPAPVTIPPFPNSIPLIQGYVTGATLQTWPGGTLRFGAEGPGNIESLSVANPAAGADWLFTVPGGQRMRIQSVNAQLATSAAAGNRVVRVQIKDGAAFIVWQSGPNQNIPASTTAQVSMGTGQVTTTVDTLSVNVALPGVCVLESGWTVATNTINIQAADQWSAIRLAVEEWIEGP